ncbi:hypothetical protein [Colwellia echini]|uniref:Uncharacterized protein n=1 Tax=Colwellia echini TaxID=1982103 RepID=A0ABY3MTR4_9GAMM|nr:hypothetical protein [Colwellia echini]TYK64575.1 hypothetical protein CWS31_015085 [Colwellia echini]
MKLTTKVTLFSLLVFPGSGHIILKKYVSATAFIISFSYLVITFIINIRDITQKVVDSVLQGKIPLEVAAIQQALVEQGAIDNPNLTIMSYLMLILWLISAFDAYRIAQKKQ